MTQSSNIRLTILAEQLRRSVPGGIGTYVKGLLCGLQTMGSECPNVELFASGSPSVPDPLQQMGFPLKLHALSARVLPLLLQAPDRVSQFARVSRGSDLVHATSLLTAATGRVPLTAMVHDLAWREVPEAFPVRGRRWHETALRHAIRRASVLIVPSERTAGALMQAGADASRIEIVEEGADHLPEADEGATTSLLDSLGVKPPFILSVGTVEPRKNLNALISAYQEVRHRLPEPWPLLLVGPIGWRASKSAMPLPDGVIPTGRVSEAVLAGLYRRARCLVYIPLLEGYGLPAVEAMNAGAPVIASAIPSVGDAARIVDPHNVHEIAQAMLNVCTDDVTRDELTSRGSNHVEGRTWRKAASRHVEIWKALL